MHSLSTLPSGVSIHNSVLSLDFHSRNVTFVFNIPQVVSHRPSCSNQNQIQIKYSTKIAIIYYLIWTKFPIVSMKRSTVLLLCTYFIYWTIKFPLNSCCFCVQSWLETDWIDQTNKLTFVHSAAAVPSEQYKSIVLFKRSPNFFCQCSRDRELKRF